MLTSLKYEFRRNRSSLIVLAVIFALLEGFFLFNIHRDKDSWIAISIVLLVLASIAMYFYVLFSSVSAYKRDIEQKSGYLVFMTPISTYAVIGAKLLCTLITGIGIVVFIGVLAVIDWNILVDNVGGLKFGINLVKQIFKSMNIPYDQILLGIIAMTLVFLISFYLLVAIAYLAISLSSTILQNKKGKNIISFIFFIALYVIVTVISNKIPKPYSATDNLDLLKVFIRFLPQYLFFIVVSVACFFGSAWLLENKISL